MSEKVYVHVEKVNGPWQHFPSKQDAIFSCRMGAPLFQFRWPWKWMPKSTTLKKLNEGILGFSVSWHRVKT